MWHAFDRLERPAADSALEGVDPLDSIGIAETPRRKRVGIDGHVLCGKPQGSKTYVLKMLQCLRHVQLGFDVVVYCEDPARVRSLIGASGFEYRKILRTGPSTRLLWYLPLLFARHRIDLGVFQHVVPPLGTTKSLVVIHDLLPYTHPEIFPPWFRYSRQALMGLSIRRAAAVVAASETARQDIAAVFPRHAAQCEVSSCGPSFDTDALLSTAPAALPAPLAVGEKYVLTVGRIEKRKNIKMLTGAFLRAAMPNVRLVIVGRTDLGYCWTVPNSPAVVHLQGIADEELLALYHNAALFAYPSMAEGFGIPLLDGLLAGLPTVSSDRRQLATIGADCARFFDPTSPDAEQHLSDILVEHFTRSPIPRPSMVQRLQLAARYDWLRNAEIFKDVIARALQ